MELRLRDLVEALKLEIESPPVSDPKFRVAVARLTTKVVVRESTSGKAGIEVFVLSAGVESGTDSEHAHEVTLELHPLTEITLGSALPDIG